MAISAVFFFSVLDHSGSSLPVRLPLPGRILFILSVRLSVSLTVRLTVFPPRISPGQIRDELEDCAAETADPGKTTRDILQKHAAKTYYNERGSGGGGGGAGGPEGRRRRSTFSDEARLPDRIDGSKSVAKPGNSSPARAGVGGGGGSGGNGGGGGGASSVSRYTRETKPSVLALEAKRDPNNFETLKKCWNHKFADPNKISIHVRPNQEGGIDFVIFVRFFMGGIFLRFHF